MTRDLARPIADRDISPMPRQEISGNLVMVSSEIVLSAILFSVVFLFMRKRILQGCDNLTAGAREIASGNLDYRIHSKQKMNSQPSATIQCNGGEPRQGAH